MYKIIYEKENEANSAVLFEERVVALMKEGWTPLGPPGVWHATYGLMFQALTLQIGGGPK